MNKRLLEGLGEKLSAQTGWDAEADLRVTFINVAMTSLTISSTLLQDQIHCFFLANRRTVYDFAKHEDVPAGGGPDGMTIDTNGNLWVAVFGGGGVFNIDPRSGKLIRKIDIPSPQTTSVAFGGVNNDELYVVSANILPEEQAKLYPDAGFTFRVTGLGVRGAPMAPAEINA